MRSRPYRERGLPFQMKTIRVVFEKRGRAVYISHLDLNRAMGRSLARSNLPVWYTQGFNPHIYTTFALPLSLGVESSYELMDFRIVEDVDSSDIVDKINMVLPEGICVLSAAEAVKDPKEIMWADYKVVILCDKTCGEAAFLEIGSIESLLAEKRSKKGMKTVDIKPLFEIIALNPIANGIEVVMRCRAGVETNLNPSLAVEAVSKRANLEISKISYERLAILDSELNNFL